MKLFNFIGVVGEEEIVKTVGTAPWQPMLLVAIPFSVISPPSGYMLTMGSANLSMATTSTYGVTYVAGIDIIRNDFTSNNCHESLINIDHYIASSINPYQYGIYKTPSTDYHWLKLSNPILQDIPIEWRVVIRAMIEKKR